MALSQDSAMPHSFADDPGSTLCATQSQHTTPTDECNRA